MASRHVWLVIAIAGLIGVGDSAAFAQVVEPRTVRVQLKVSADADIKGQIHSAMATELLGLQGVLVTDQSSDFTISVIALKVVNQSRRNVGTTFSVLITESFAERIRNKLSELNLPTDAREHLASLLREAVQPRGHWVETASAGELRKACKSIVQSFVKDTLGERRQGF